MPRLGVSHEPLTATVGHSATLGGEPTPPHRGTTVTRLHAHPTAQQHLPRWECPRTGCTSVITGRSDDEQAARVNAHRADHDLADLARYYPLLEQLLDHTRLPNTRGGSRSGSGGGMAVPVNLTVLEFVDDGYLDADGTCVAGVKRSLVALEATVAAALGLTPTPRGRADGYAGVGVDTRILDLIAWLRSMTTRVALRNEPVLDDLRWHLHRLNSRAEHLLYGARFSSTWSRCPDCAAPGPGGLGTVLAGKVAAGQMAVCVNYPTCHGEDGRRSCWRYDPDVEEWLRVPEPAESRLDGDAERLLTVAAQTGVAR